MEPVKHVSLSPSPKGYPWSVMYNGHLIDCGNEPTFAQADAEAERAMCAIPARRPRSHRTTVVSWTHPDDSHRMVSEGGCSVRTLTMPLSVDSMPLSWRCEPGMEAITEGRRVWGPRAGEPMYRLRVVDGELALTDAPEHCNWRVIQRWPNDPSYDSPWGGEGKARLAQVAEWNEGQAFNAWQSETNDPRYTPTP